MLTGLAVIAVIPGMGAGIYLMVIGTPLEDSIATLVAFTGVLIFQIVKRHRDASNVWLLAGVVLPATWQVVSAFAQHRGWPAHELAVVASAGDWVRWAVLPACIGMSIVVGIRSGSLNWPPWRFSDHGSADAPPGDIHLVRNCGAISPSLCTSTAPTSASWGRASAGRMTRRSWRAEVVTRPGRRRCGMHKGEGPSWLRGAFARDRAGG